MRLAEAQSRKLLPKHGVYITEACDGCGKILGHVRFTRYGEPGDWCSRLCRDGVEQKTGACRNCGADLKERSLREGQSVQRLRRSSLHTRRDIQ
jgi:hypothetical protein